MILSNISQKKAKNITFHTVMQILLLVVGMLYIFPLLWMLSTALKSPTDFMSNNFLPKKLLWHNFADAISAIPFLKYTFNSLFVSVLVTLGTVLSSTLVGYSFARLRWPGRNILFVVLLGTLMLPAQVLQVQNFILFNKLGWINTYLPLTVPFFFNAGAFNIFLLRQFFRGIPMELSEASKIDGCSEFRICYGIVMPLCIPIITAVAVFAFMNSWNDFFNPLLYLNNPDMFTLALGLRAFQQQFGTQWNYMMAVSLLSMLPTLALFFGFQRYFVEGITLGGVKE